MVKIEFSNCGKSYNRRWLFRNLNARLVQGEKWVILGPNGSGKSTISLMLAGQVWPTEGSIQRFESDKPLKPELAHRYISLASPAMELPGEFNFTEILGMHSIAKPMLPNAKIDFLAELCGFDSKTLSKPLSHFSSGMLQRVKLVLAVFTDCPVLLLDEPLSNLDKSGIDLYNQLIQEYTNQRLLVVASNRKDEYFSCTQAIEVIPGGSVVVHNQLA